LSPDLRNLRRPSRSARCALVPAAALATALLAPSSAPAETAFRFSLLALRDPHTYAYLPFLGCRDITDTVPLGLSTPFNGMLQNSIDTDGNGDGKLDLSGLIYFVPQEVVVGTAGLGNGTQWNPEDADGELIFHFGSCTAPLGGTMCEPDLAQAIQRLAYANDPSQPCLGEIPGTRYGSYTAPSFPGSPCFVTEPFDMTLTVGGIPVPLVDVQLGATYQDTLPPRLVDGLVRGFLREATADSVILPSSISIVGGNPLSSLLPGGTGCCSSHDDRDVSGGETGWWVYLDFEADEVPFDAVTGVGEGVAAAPGAGPSLVVAPNPSAGSIVLVAGAPAGALARLDVYDVSGRRVRALGPLGAFGGAGSGTRRIAWDGKDAAGRPLAAGVYFVRLRADDRVVTRRIVRRP